MEDFIYEKVKAGERIALEIVSGGNHYKGKVWNAIATQIYCESGGGEFRDIGHLESGAPFLYGENERISISHTDGCLVVASVQIPEDLPVGQFDHATCLGVDVERVDREKVLRLRERFLTPEEQTLVPADSLEANIMAWTAKEAMLKASLTPGINWHTNLLIKRMPALADSPGAMDLDNPGKGLIILPDGEYPVDLFSLRYEDFIITVAATR